MVFLQEKLRPTLVFLFRLSRDGSLRHPIRNRLSVRFFPFSQVLPLIRSSTLSVSRFKRRVRTPTFTRIAIWDKQEYRCRYPQTESKDILRVVFRPLPQMTPKNIKKL